MDVLGTVCPACGHVFHSPAPPGDIRQLKMEGVHAAERALLALRQSRGALSKAGLHVAGRALDETITTVRKAVELFSGL